jgi:extracellular factor (EF) 3-hydroxypalmitic acid methyl ester biosynthesis protein
MVNQILGDPRQGPTTYFQMVNTAFLQTEVAQAHRNRIDILVAFLADLANEAKAVGRPFRVLNVGCGPAVEIQRFLREYDEPNWLQFQLVDFSNETLDYTKSKMAEAAADAGIAAPQIEYFHQSVHELLKRKINSDGPDAGDCDAAYCAGLFDYLSDKVCSRLLSYFAYRTGSGGKLLVTNVHKNNPERFFMEHILEWYLIYRDEAQMLALLTERAIEPSTYVDATGVNVFLETRLA